MMVEYDQWSYMTIFLHPVLPPLAISKWKYPTTNQYVGLNPVDLLEYGTEFECTNLKEAIQTLLGNDLNRREGRVAERWKRKADEMGDKGKRDKGKREDQKKGKTLKEKRKQKEDKKKEMTITERVRSVKPL
ncbi:MAG: hypothetical protein C4530_23995 [Desulfobacteraceae bacterium]|nr:MAG: hypothetical protein C4530_23995 [Desulfobacteraceae bacterium]